MTKDEKREIRLRLASECATAEEYDVRSALEGVSARWSVTDRFWRYLKFKPFFDLVDRLFRNDVLRFAATIFLACGSVVAVGLECAYAVVGSLLLVAALLAFYMVYTSHVLTGMEIKAYPERVQMSKPKSGGFTISISIK